MEKIIKAKSISIVLLFMMVFQLMMPVNFAYAAGRNVEGQIDASKTTINVKINSKGPVDGKFENVVADSTIEMSYKFAFLNEKDGVDLNYEPGDYFYVNFPSPINISNLSPRVLKMEGLEIATLEMDGTKAKITFIEGVLTVPSDIEVNFNASGTFEESIQNSGGEVEIDLVYTGTTIKVGVIPKPTKPVDLTLEKLNPTVDINNGEISWTVKVRPKNVGETANNVILKDFFTTENHTYLDETFKVNGKTVTGSAIVDSTTSGSAIKYTDYGFEYTFPEPISNEQIITYKTKIDVNSFKSEGKNGSTNIVYNNKVSAYMGNQHKGDKESSTTIDWINKSRTLVDGDRKIEWKVTINNKDGYLNDKDPVKIIDNIDTKQLFVPKDDSKYPMKLELTKADGSVESIIGAALTSAIVSGNELIYTFDTDVVFTKAVLTYYTEINNPSANSNNTATYTNTAKLIWGASSTDGPSDSSSIGIGMGIIDKNSDGPNTIDGSSDIIINWTVYINKNKIVIENAEFKDKIPGGLIYDENSFKIDGLAVTPTAIYTPETGMLTYNMGKIDKKTHTITYSTKVDKNSSGLFANNVSGISFSNEAKLYSGSLIGGEQNDKVDHKLKSEVIKKAVIKGYNYLTREVEWEIVVNKNKIPLTNVGVSDIIPLGMSFIPGEFYVDGTKISIDNPKFVYVVKGDNNTTDNDSFSYSIGNIDKEVKITYKTKVKEDYLNLESNFNKTLHFKNKATVYAEGRKDVTVEVDTTMDNTVVEKNGEQIAADFVEWSVPINISKLTIGGPNQGITLTDELQEGLSLDVNSVKLYRLNVASDGSYTDAEVIDFRADNENYSMSYNSASRKFEFTFKNGMSDAYRLEFVTDVLVDSITIRNSINFNGQGKSTTSDADDLEVNVNNFDGGAGGTSGALKVIKVDENGNPLSGAKILVHDKAKTPRFTFETNYQAEHTKTGLAFRWYYFEELEAPAGYFINENIEPVKINSSVEQVVRIENIKAVAGFSFIKQDSEGKVIPNMTFTLSGVDIFGNSINIRKNSDINGIVSFENIHVGEYKLNEETKAGYKELPPIDVKLERHSNQKEMVITFNGEAYDPDDLPVVKNEFTEIYGEIIVNKVDKNQEPLPGAEFTLYKQENDEVIGEPKISKADGTVKFENVPLGEYYIVETKAPDGYLRSTVVVDVTVERDSDPSKTKVLYSITGSESSSIVPIIENRSIDFALNKKDVNGALSGIEFKLYKEGETEAFMIKNSDAVGDVEFTVIPAGKYYIKETTPSTHKPLEKEIIVEIVINSNEELEITFSYSDNSEVEIDESGKLVVMNEKKPTSPGGGGVTTPVYGKVAVKKVDEDKKVLSGAEFTLYDSKGKVVGKAVTGSDGTVSFEELEPGEYVLKETKAPEGYVLDEKETDVTISANKTSSYTFTNRKEEPKKPGRIEIIKTDEEGKLLSDAWFSLIDENGSTLQNAGTVNGRVVFEDVPAGRYTVKEVQAPEGYELSSKTVTVTVESNKTVELSFVNKKAGTPVVPANGRITINKVDENSNALEGAEFTLYDENSRIVETAVSDKDGKVVFENLKDGRYFVKETKAPEGYVLANEAKIVDVAGGQTYSYKFKNVPESLLIEDPDVPMGWETIDEPDVPKGVGTLPNTGYILNTWMLAALGLLLIAEGIFLRKRRRITN